MRPAMARGSAQKHYIYVIRGTRRRETDAGSPQPATSGPVPGT
ncbi:hypothetical protein PXO_05557 [Xanthomonas oryzae pv. oryzae PXO99A]|uniref:Uncharacterized protein n=1 Tax=Xanthomonas oryzae pv. oryzae (strain PXO99A) TaxID=360094 RepID=A0A0K0GJC7_XANOP|nr:hypothetical protein PXO_05557 [Xanthomonas oryzae pv. oryzae PXO99A]